MKRLRSSHDEDEHDNGKDEDAMQIDLTHPASIAIAPSPVRSFSDPILVDSPASSPNSFRSDSTATALSATLSASTLDSSSTPSSSLSAPSSEDTSPLLRPEPIFATLNELREQRMSMVGNYRQYVCVVACTLVGALAELEEEKREIVERSAV